MVFIVSGRCFVINQENLFPTFAGFSLPVYMKNYRAIFGSTCAVRCACLDVIFIFIYFHSHPPLSLTPLHFGSFFSRSFTAQQKAFSMIIQRSVASQKSHRTEKKAWDDWVRPRPEGFSSSLLLFYFSIYSRLLHNFTVPICGRGVLCARVYKKATSSPPLSPHSISHFYRLREISFSSWKWGKRTQTRDRGVREIAFALKTKILHIYSCKST